MCAWRLERDWQKYAVPFYSKFSLFLNIINTCIKYWHKFITDIRMGRIFTDRNTLDDQMFVDTFSLYLYVLVEHLILDKVPIL